MAAKKRTAKMPNKYAPEVEARRSDYQQFTETLIQLCAFHSQRAPAVLDVESSGWLEPEPEPFILWYAVQEHLRALFENLLLTYSDDFMRTLYVELRLYFDQKMVEASSGAFRYTKGRRG